MLHIDATYWGRDFGVIIMRDSLSNKVVWRKFINQKEKLSDYKEGIDWLKENNFNIIAIICDGFKGIFKQFSEYKIQMCQYHQIKILRRYLTSKPELLPAIELLRLVNQITEMDKASFLWEYSKWLKKRKSFLDEYRLDDKGKKIYLHKRLRSANRSLWMNMRYLWTWYDYKELNIPNTNNSLEGYFSHLKRHLNSHSGLSKENRKRFIDKYISKGYE